MEQKEYERMW